MKNVLRVLAIILMMNVGSSLTINKAHAQEGEVSFQVFYDDMSPYGNWVDYPGTGYVWIPNVDAGFSPYGSNGHWVLTEYGWTWVSDYPWGWAPFHYGRWNYDNSYGWGWCPDYEWGPAWVSWRSCDGYYGWCPMGYGMNLEGSYGRGGYSRDDNRWTFVHDRDLGRQDISSRYESRTNNTTLMRNTSVVRNTYADNSRLTTYAAGPTRADVQKTSGKPVETMRVTSGGKSGGKESNGTVAMYRPQVQKNNGGSIKPSSNSVITPKDVKPIGKREYINQQKPQSPITTPERKAAPSTPAPARDNAPVPKKDVPITPKPKKDVPVQPTPNKEKAPVQRKDVPITPQQKNEITPQPTPNRDKVDAPKRDIPNFPQPQRGAPIAPQIKQEAPVHQPTRQENINRARQGSNPPQPNREAPARPNPPRQNVAPKPPEQRQQPVRQNTPPPQPQRDAGRPKN